MPLVSESHPLVKQRAFKPFQVMLIVLATQRAVYLAESQRQLVLQSMNGLIDCVLRFMGQSPTPQGMFEFERELAEQLRQLGLTMVQFALNNLEPDVAHEMPSRMRRGTAEYSRKGRKTRHRGGVACRFGMLELSRWSYEPLSEESESGLRSIVPLAEQLGLVAGKATPALAEIIGRLSSDRPENSVVEFLRREHAVTLAAETVCLVRDAVAQGISQHLQAQQAHLVVNAIRTGRSQGHVILAAGRDGIYLPMRGTKDDRWKEGAVGTITVYVKSLSGKLRRLCTVYLGQMPKPGQEELSDNLTNLLQLVLSDESARNIQLVYLTDAGHHPQDYYKRVLRNMNDPFHPGRKLEWIWVVDFFHVSIRLNHLADALFRNANTASAWVRRMRHILKHESNAVNRILHSAAYWKPKSLRGKEKETYDTAYQYLLSYSDHMDYATYQSQDLPIGSGVTEAACKTVFTQRFKCSGMLWNRENDYDHRDPDATRTGARSVLTLRLAVLSRVWPAVFQAFLATTTINAQTIVNRPLAS
jgi:hypothetical protein